MGGYNLESDGYTGVAYDSCEQMGQSMFINYTATNDGPYLYHLVFIGEQGIGDIQFMVKTCFNDSDLTPISPPSRVYPGNSTELSFSSNTGANLQTAQLSYTTNNWASSNNGNMTISNQTCSAIIPGQIAGTTVQYQVHASDVLLNSLQASGNYPVKEPLILNITTGKEAIRLGENITINGVSTPIIQNAKVNVQFSSINSTQIINCTVNDKGAFEASFKPDATGEWAVTATSPETQTSYRYDSQQLILTVIGPPIYVKYSLSIIAGLVAALAVGGVIYFLKSRK